MSASRGGGGGGPSMDQKHQPPRSVATAGGTEATANRRTKKQKEEPWEDQRLRFFEKGEEEPGGTAEAPKRGPAWCAWIWREGKWQLATATQDGRVQAHVVADPNGTGSSLGPGCRPLPWAAATAEALAAAGGGGGDEAPLTLLAASPDGRTLVACQDQYVRLLSTATLEPVGTAGRQMLPVRAAALCPAAAAGVVAASASAAPEGGGGGAGPASAPAAAPPPPMLLAMGGDDPTVKLVALPPPASSALKQRAGGSAGAGEREGGGEGEDDGAARCARARAFRSVVGDGYVRALAVDPDGAFVAARLRDGSVAVWDAATGRQVARRRVGAPDEQEEGEGERGGAAGGGGGGAGSGGERGNAPPPSGGPRPPPPSCGAIDWHPDGGALLAAPGDDADVALLERLSWRPVAYLAHPRAHASAVTTVAFSPNGMYCASASAKDGRVAVWRVGDGGGGGGLGGGGGGGGLGPGGGGSGGGGALVCTARVVQAPSPPSSSAASSMRVTRLAWHPSADCLVVSGACGGVAVWRGVVANAAAATKGGVSARRAAQLLPSPWRPLDELLREADESGRRGGRSLGGDGAGRTETETEEGEEEEKRREEEVGERGRRRRAAAAAGLDDDDEEDEEDEEEEGDEGGNGGRRRQPRKHVKRPRAGSSEGEDGEEEEQEEDDDDLGGDEEEGASDDEGLLGRRRRSRRRRCDGGRAAGGPRRGRAPRLPPRVQAPVQPGATQPSLADAALYATKNQPPAADASRIPRFLAYTSLGCVVARPLEAGAGAGVGAQAAALPRAQALEVAFHDVGAAGRARAPVLTDYYGVTLAALGARGVAYASPPLANGGGGGGAPQPAMLLFRPFGARAAGSDWSVALPDPGEAPRCLAVGASWVAVATSRRLLRVYSLAGRQLAVAALPGDAVALAARGGSGGEGGGGGGNDDDDDGAGGEEGSGGDEGEGDRLAVAWADGPPEQGTGTEYDGTQRLSVWVARLREGGLVGVGGGVGGGGFGGGGGGGPWASGAPCRLPLSPGASLRWLGFSEPEGLLAAYDTAGVLRLKPCAGSAAVEAWTPVVVDAAAAQAAAAQAADAGEEADERAAAAAAAAASSPSSSLLLFGVSPDTVWPVSASASQLLSVVCRDARASCGPPVVPKPVLTALPLRVPGAAASGGGGGGGADGGLLLARQEDEWLRARLACRARGTAAAAAVGTERGVAADGRGGGRADAAARAASDKAALRLLHAALKAGRHARALELVGALALDRSVEGALRLAAHQRGAAALADRVAAYLEQRQEQLQRRQQAHQPQRLRALGLGWGAPPPREAEEEGEEEEGRGVGGGSVGARLEEADGGAGGSDQRQHQQPQQGRMGAGGGGGAASLAPSSAAAAAFAAQFASAGGAGQKKKSNEAATSAARRAGGGGGGGGATNPFARVNSRR